MDSLQFQGLEGLLERGCSPDTELFSVQLLCCDKELCTAQVSRDLKMKPEPFTLREIFCKLQI